MRTLLLHLSDLHIQGSGDPILKRAKEIVDATKNLDYELELAVLVLSGDLAYSGDDAQYQLAGQFIQEIAAGLGGSLKHKISGKQVPIGVVLVPGNHDCNFSSGSQKARSMVLRTVLQEPAQALDPSIVETGCAPQAAFFAFLEGVTPNPRKKLPSEPSGRLYYEYEFSESAKKLRFLCCNTAWCSELRETQGQLTYPPSALPEATTQDDVVIAVLHHPYNWLESNVAREFRKRIEKIADLVLTGHEHDAGCRTQQNSGGERQTYVEGGALQETDRSEISAFNAFLLDTAHRKQKYIQFAWNGSIYSPRKDGLADEGGEAAWVDFQGNRIRQRGRFEVRTSTREMLEDPGIVLQHRTRGRLKLADIFVYPDLRRIPGVDEKVGELIRGEDVIQAVLKKPNLLIIGDDQMGKSSLAKMLFVDLHQAGYVPLLLSSENKPPTDDKLYGFLYKRFEEQYESGGLESYKQLDCSRRVVLIDDYDKFQFKPKHRKAFLGALSKFAGRIVLFAHDLTFEIEEISNPSLLNNGGPAFERYHLCPFGYLRRDKLVEKWLLASEAGEEGGPEFARKLQKVSDTISTLIGKNFVPSYPVYILAVLQGYEAGTPVDTRASTHGYFYELLIRAALAKGRTGTDFDILTAYLAHLAYRCFTGRIKQLTHEHFLTFHKEYEERMDIKKDPQRMLKELDETRILVESGGAYRFSYPYIYYYFVAAYMRDHLAAEEVRQQLDVLSRAVHVEENANILLFLAHLSKDPIIVEKMRGAAERFFPESSPAELGRDVDFISSIAQLALPATYRERDHKTARYERLEALDKEDEQGASDLMGMGDTSDPEKAMLNPVIRMGMAIRTLQILGQTLKNFPGSIEGQVKLQIAQSCYALGRRALTNVLTMFRENKEAIVTDMARIIGVKYPKMSAAELAEHAKGGLIGMALLVCFAMVKRLSHAVGSPGLESTYKKLVDQDPTPCVKLVNTSIALDHAGSFPVSLILSFSDELHGNPVALSLLQHLVVQHFELFPVKYQDKQRICQKLNIEVSKVAGPGGPKGLLSGKPEGRGESNT